mmetsp:Transcript_3279/g.11183  ORF Transcript_3279/g.11183 Transcript_3279/m.11183 type:complete len:164 (+) Transcript_3279:2274-2765(+)
MPPLMMRMLRATIHSTAPRYPKPSPSISLTRLAKIRHTGRSQMGRRQARGRLDLSWLEFQLTYRSSSSEDESEDEEGGGASEQLSEDGYTRQQCEVLGRPFYPAKQPPKAVTRWGTKEEATDSESEAEEEDEEESPRPQAKFVPGRIVRNHQGNSSESDEDSN